MARPCYCAISSAENDVTAVTGSAICCLSRMVRAGPSPGNNPGRRDRSMMAGQGTREGTPRSELCGAVVSSLAGAKQ
jgi:hypothetical protein